MSSPRMLKCFSVLSAAALTLSTASIHAGEKPAAAPASASTTLGQPDANGFISLFNGKDLTGWEGLEGFWSVKGGVIALQMHAGFTMDIQFKDISIKFLDGNP